MELGSAAEWVGAIGTAGALLATVFLIFDNERRSRSADAAAVSVWFTQRFISRPDGTDSRFIDVHLFNGSPAPLPSVTIYSRIEGRDYIEEVLSSAGAKLAAIEPGASHSIEIPVIHFVDVDRVFVFFFTRDGKRWARRLGDGRLMPGLKARYLANGATAFRAALARSYPDK
jgi:hypothetical protein